MKVNILVSLDFPTQMTPLIIQRLNEKIESAVKKIVHKSVVVEVKTIE